MSHATENDSFNEENEAVGQTSDEMDQPRAKSKYLDMNVYEIMLMIALLCIAVATILMLVQLRTFGDFPGGFPWRTDEFLVK